MNLEYCPPIASGGIFTWTTYTFLLQKVDFEDFMLAGLHFKAMTIPSVIHFLISKAYEWKVCVCVCVSMCLCVRMYFC